MTEDEMVGWHHQLDGHEFEQAPGFGDRQGRLMCCIPWHPKESDMTDWLNWIAIRSIEKAIASLPLECTYVFLEVCFLTWDSGNMVMPLNCMQNHLCVHVRMRTCLGMCWLYAWLVGRWKFVLVHFLRGWRNSVNIQFPKVSMKQEVYKKAFVSWGPAV